MNEELAKYQEMAKAYLAKKERVNYYQTKSVYYESPDYSYLLAELSNDEVRQLKALKERYGEDFISHLSEVITDPDVISDMFFDEPVDIDLETIHHQYTFHLRTVNGEKVTSRSILVELSDDDYCRLLAWHLYDSHLVMNTLFYRDEELCRKIMHESMRYVSDGIVAMVDDPFVITMDEALADADAIRKQNSLEKSVGYVGPLFF